MKKHLVFLFLGLFLPGTSGADTKPLKIGVIAPLTGNAAAWGEDVRNAILFANQRFGANRLEFVWEDDQCTGKNAVTAAQKLMSVDQVDIGVVVCTESTLSVAPLFERRKTLLISPVASGAAVSHAGDYIFRMWPSDQFAATMLVKHLPDSIKTLGILTEERGYSTELTQAVERAASGLRLSVKNETYATGTTDFRALLLRLQKLRVDALLINTNGEGLFATILRQIRELNWKPPLYGVYMPGSPVFLDHAGDFAEGIEFVDAPSVDGTMTDEGRELYIEYLKVYRKPQSSSFVFASTIEAIRRIVSLSDNPANWRHELYTGKFDGIFGAYTFDQNGDIEGVEHVIKKIVSGRSIVVEQKATGKPDR